jgi:lipoprotein NlpD
MLLAGCADTGGNESPAYVVRPQDTLYSIAWRHNLDYRDVARWNHIGPDFRITVGQRLLLAPTGPEPQVRRAPPAAAVAPASRAPSSGLKWTWPTELIGTPQPVPSGGMLLAGRLGQDIHAACAGRVVYSGSGLRGYGNLLIIKHGENLLSAYAHNRDLLVKDGEDVALGQVIAHMGEGAPNKPVLYFEIRRDGKPVEAKAYLPILK